MALEWLRQEIRALLPQGQRWLSAMRHELARVQALHRRERARERLLQSELDTARAALASWQARRDVAAGLPRAELADAASIEVQRRAAEVEALQVVLAKQTALMATVTEKLTAMEARFLAASEQSAQPRRPELLISHTLAELSQRERRFEQCELQLQREWPRSPAIGHASTIEPSVEHDAVTISPPISITPPPATDADFVTAASSADKSERAP